MMMSKFFEPWVNYNGIIRGHPDFTSEDQVASVIMGNDDSERIARLVESAPHLHSLLISIMQCNENDEILPPSLIADIESALDFIG